VRRRAGSGRLRPTFVLLPALIIAGCGQRVHVVGRVAVEGGAPVSPDASAIVDAPVAPPDVSVAGRMDARPDAALPEAAPPPDAPPLASVCQPQSPCMLGFQCAAACSAADGGVLTCICENGRLSICSVQPYRCASEADCQKRQDCSSRPAPCFYCDATVRSGVLCQCNGVQNWECVLDGHACP